MLKRAEEEEKNKQKRGRRVKKLAAVETCAAPVGSGSGARLSRHTHDPTRGGREGKTELYLSSNAARRGGEEVEKRRGKSTTFPGRQDSLKPGTGSSSQARPERWRPWSAAPSASSAAFPLGYPPPWLA